MDLALERMPTKVNLFYNFLARMMRMGKKIGVKIEIQPRLKSNIL
jgi:hypothetical protein